MPLERWASAAPSTRWPLVLLGLLALWGVAGYIAPPLEWLL